MTSTQTKTFNREDIRRVHGSFAADYRIVAEWTELHTKSFVDRTIDEIGALAEEQYLSVIHLRLTDSAGSTKEAAVYRVSTDASSWSSERPGDLYWEKKSGDRLRIHIEYSAKWWALTLAQREAFEAIHMKDWGTSDFDGNYTLSASQDRQYASRAYGLKRTRYSGA